MIPDISRFDGTFHICKGCKTPNGCCTGNIIDRAILKPDEIRNICLETGLKSSVFSITTNNYFSNMKLIDNKCYFYKSNKCTIYNIRPLDCRLFPFDIKRSKNRELILVYYTTVCPSLIDIDIYKNKALFLISCLGDYLDEYTDHHSPLLAQLEYKIATVLKL
jgi:Fe-S-cluster containining protein